MRAAALALLAAAWLGAEVEFRGHADLRGDAYVLHPEGKHPDGLTAMGQLEATYEGDNIRAHLQLNAQGDYYDLRDSDEHNGRSFFRVDEAYAVYMFDEDEIMAGRSVRFWGALEVINIIDGFNPLDLRNGIFETDKIGVWNAAWTHLTETGEVQLIVKFYEEDQPMGSDPYVYYFFPPFVTYESRLKRDDSRYRPTVYLRYAGSTDTEYALDYAVIVQHGYDSQRYFASSGPLIGLPVTFTSHAYLVNKVMTSDTLVIGSTLVKFEGLFADVIREPTISDYYHLGFGIEHTLSQIYGDADLGIIAEYYYYDTLQKGAQKYDDLALFQVMQNDLFTGIRISANDADDSSLVGGVIFDLDYNEQAYYAEFETRLFETFKLNLDYRYVEPSKNTMTAYRFLQRHQSGSVILGYYF